MYFHIINNISGITLFLALIVVLFFTILKFKKIKPYFIETPLSLKVISFFCLIWGLFFVPKTFSGRGDFGVWLMSYANSSWEDLLANTRAPVYFWRTRIFAEIFDGINYDLIVSLNFINFFISVFLVYILVNNLTKNKKAAYASSFFYLFSPVIFTFSLTEDYALLALFFTLLSLFFLSIKIDTADDHFLIAAMGAALLAAGSRIDYIFFPYIFIIFYLLFIKEKSWKIHFGRLFLFLLAIIPRTISSVGMYFEDAQHDIALHGKVYEYSGNIFSYMTTVFLGASEFFSDNLETGIDVIVNFRDLTAVFFFLGLISLFFAIIKKGKNRKVIFFFSGMMIFSFFYYTYFHAVAGIGAYRYMITLLTPLIIVAGIGYGTILEKKPFLFYLGLQLLILFSVITLLFPLRFQNHTNLIPDYNLRQQITFNYPEVVREYHLYKQLSYENKLSKYFHKKDTFDISRGKEKTYFIINGERSFLHSMPIHGKFIPVWEIDDLYTIEKHIDPNDKIYINQPEIGFTSSYVDGITLSSSDEFREKILELFTIKREIISYDVNGHHAFLYEVKKINK